MESLAIDLTTYVRRPIEEAHLKEMYALGELREHAEGEIICKMGQEIDTFYYVEAGELVALDPVTGERYGAGSLGPTQWFGEIGFLTGGKAMLGAQVTKPARILHVERTKMLRLMSQIPELSDLVITVMAARRRRLLESNQAGLVLIGEDVDRSVRRIAGFAARNKIPYRSIPIGDTEALDWGKTCSLKPDTPAVIYGKDQVIEDPTPRKIAQLYGLDLTFAKDELHDVLIVGGGPAGTAAGVYAGAEGLSALVLEDLTIGGQAGTSSRIENYMGFPTGISGADLVWRGEVQAMKFGKRFAVPRRAAKLEYKEDKTFHVTLQDGDTACAKAIVVATGVQYRRLPVENLESFEGAGIYYAATEVEARTCRNSEAVVIGGGNSAGQAAMYLARSSAHVHLLVRGPSLAASMSDYLSSRIEQNPRITIHYNSQMTCLHGEDTLHAIDITGPDGARRQPTGAVFVMVGAAPNTGWLSGLVELDDRGFVKTGNDVGADSPFATSHPGIFAVGDVRAGSVKRVASAVGEGSVVISKVWDHVRSDDD